ncbi:hypothetical protein FRC12_018123 [Ceratobasidium sp. 428]|nr:hypothetical protein FRC12_018123 [Ceratobasidium sp. 428]
MNFCQRFRTEGFTHIDPESPYTPDVNAIERNEQLITRLSCFPTFDFAAGKDADRARLLKDLPQDLEDFVELMRQHTGAEICVFASWRNARDELSHFSAATPYSWGWISEERDKDWALFSIRENGDSLCYDVQHAPQRVYGAFDGSYRPWFPATTQNSPPPRKLIREYVHYMAEYHSLDTLIAWELGLESPDDNNRLINPVRLPAKLTHLIDPANMLDSDVWALTLHIIKGQHAQLPNSQVFQLLGNRMIAEDTHVISNVFTPRGLQYDEGSWLYLARCMSRNSSDILALVELINMLPLICHNP